MILTPKSDSGQDGLLPVRHFLKLHASVLLDGNKQTFFLYRIEVSGPHDQVWEVEKRQQQFEELQSVLLKKGYFVPLIPHKTSRGPQHPAFLGEKKKYLAVWLKELFSSDDIRHSLEFRRFFHKAPKASKLTESTSSSLQVPKIKKDHMRAEPVRLKDFTLLAVIGKGSFGKVMLVRKIDDKKIYAMKALQKDNVVKRNQVEHTKTERSVLEYIRHPFIVTLRYAFQTKYKLYFVLDYCPGGELFFHLGRAGRFSEQRARLYAAQIILALEYLHTLDIVYRDLKPENVLLDAEGFVMLTDFGLSKEGIADNTSAHSFCGTPEYLAPEILTRTGHGRAADWWSLGALLFEMLTGMPPFYSRNRDRLFNKILNAQLRMPRFFSPTAKSLLEGLLNRNAESRLGSQSDAAEIKAHPFFASIDWDKLLNREVTPPFKPTVSKITDIGNFDKEFTSMPVSCEEGKTLRSFADNRFQGFTYVNPDPMTLIATNPIPVSTNQQSFESQASESSSISSSQSRISLSSQPTVSQNQPPNISLHMLQPSNEDPPPNTRPFNQPTKAPLVNNFTSTIPPKNGSQSERVSEQPSVPPQGFVRVVSDSAKPNQNANSNSLNENAGNDLLNTTGRSVARNDSHGRSGSNQGIGGSGRKASGRRASSGSGSKSRSGSGKLVPTVAITLTNVSPTPDTNSSATGSSTNNRFVAQSFAPIQPADAGAPPRPDTPSSLSSESTSSASSSTFSSDSAVETTPKSYHAHSTTREETDSHEAQTLEPEIDVVSEVSDSDSSADSSNSDSSET
mmetsp:Transcript_37188/g.73061  ORF Transcript_37188/g.73061 Transcript_37188/m.73061 type:complete len:791 (-) Transcript_37188:294-2666(-)